MLCWNKVCFYSLLTVLETVAGVSANAEKGWEKWILISLIVFPFQVSPSMGSRMVSNIDKVREWILWLISYRWTLYVLHTLWELQRNRMITPPSTKVSWITLCKMIYCLLCFISMHMDSLSEIWIDQSGFERRKKIVLSITGKSNMKKQCFNV